MVGNWRNLSYLAGGSAVQREVHYLLTELGIMPLLAEYNPVLVGTVPLGIQVEGSDLDIICEVYDPEAFTGAASRYFGEREGFCCVTRTVEGIPRTKINFIVSGWPIELFGQPRETGLQNGYLHMIVEAKILNLLGKTFRDRIIELKRNGIKTEPAFAQLLQLEGDSYEALLSLGRLAPEELAAVCREFCIPVATEQSVDK